MPTLQTPALRSDRQRSVSSAVGAVLASCAASQGPEQPFAARRLLVASRIARLCGVAYMLALHAFLALLVYAAIDGQGPWTALELSAAQAGTQGSTLAGTTARRH